MITPTYTYAATVLRVIDGDTLDVEVDLGFRTIARLPLRVAHIDAPERFTDAGRIATAFVTQALADVDNKVVVETFKPVDKYGRYLANVYMGQVDLAVLMIARGLAVPYEGGAR